MQHKLVKLKFKITPYAKGGLLFTLNVLTLWALWALWALFAGLF